MEITTARYINVNGSLLDLSQPRVMGILNVTPDSFYAGSRTQTEAEIVRRVRQIVSEGAAIIDIGAYSSRPNADNVSSREEMERLRMGLKILFEIQPDAVVSVDTFRAMWQECVWRSMVLPSSMILRPVRWIRNVPYRCGIERTLYMMHMQGTPQSMQQHPHYDNLLKEVFLYFARKVQQLRDLGVKDIILDPGFGFGKTMEHNYECCPIWKSSVFSSCLCWSVFHVNRDIPLVGHYSSGGAEWYYGARYHLFAERC